MKANAYAKAIDSRFKPIKGNAWIRGQSLSKVFQTFAGAVIALTVLTPALATIAGRTPGSFAVDQFGQANYTIPIWTPHGPNGLQPNIALAYNSSQGNGSVGVGWGVTGISEITRCARTVAQDGALAAGPVTMAADDAYCLDGQRLQLTGGSEGTAGSTYQTEVANSELITAEGSAGGGPAYFIVRAPNGTQYEYGNTSSSAVVPSGYSSVMTWMLDKVTDGPGNTMTYTYNNSSGTAVPASISWTPTAAGSGSYVYSMNFTYQTNNAQTSTFGYVAGSAVSNTNLLTSIAITTGTAATVLKQYNLAYSTSALTSRNLLYTVQECADATQNHCLAPTTATYQTATYGISSSPTTAVSSSVQSLITNYDFNNDGIPDLLYYNGSSWYVAFGTATGYGTPINTTLTSAPGTLLAGSAVLGSHQDGILTKNSSTTTWWYYLWNGSTFSGTNTGIPVDSASSNALIDVNGDGLPDFVSFYQAAGTTADYITTRLNTSTGGTLHFASTAPVAFTDPNGGSTSSVTNNGYAFTPSNLFPNSLRSWDFNGDGRQDLFYFAASTSCVAMGGGVCTQYQTSFTAYTLLGQGNGSFLPSSTGPASGASLPQMVNWNNDKCTDLVFGSTVYISACNGKSAGTIGLAGNLYAAMDVDGDGRTDAIIVQGSTLAVQTSTGKSVNTPLSLGIPVGVGTYGRIDVGGTGLDELACLGCTTNAVTFYARNTPGTIPDLLTSIADANNNYSQPTYVSLSQVSGSHYTNGTDAAPGSGFCNYIGPMYVVAQVTNSDPSTAGGTYQLTYEYADAWQNTQGRGFMGFGSMQMSDPRNSIPIWETWTYSHSSNGFPYVGMLIGDNKNQNSATGTPISSFTRTAAVETLNATLGTQRYIPYSSQDIRTTYEVGGSKNGVAIRTRTTTYGSPDIYGNFSSVSTVVADTDSASPASPTNGASWTTAMSTTFATADTTNWCVNLPAAITTTRSSSVGATVAQTTAFTKDTNAAACRNHVATYEGATSALNVTETLTYDAFGNVGVDAISGAGISRSTTTSWTSSASTTGQFPMSVQDPSMAVTTYLYNAGGNVTQVTDPNNLVTTFAYTDGFWRLNQVTRPDHTYTTYAYEDCTAYGSCFIASHAVYTTETDFGSNNAQLAQRLDFADSVDRPLVMTTPLLSGAARNEVRYDSLGRTIQKAAPCAWVSLSTQCTSWITKTYDLRNRVQQVERPGVSATTYSYEGATTSIEDANGHTRSFAKDPNGWLRQTTDAANTYTVSLAYDAAGDKTGVSDSAGALWSGTYVYGAKPYLATETDRYRGTWTYYTTSGPTTVDALGEQLYWTDAKGQAFSATYDALGRMISRKEPDLFTQWTWGSSTSLDNVGQLQSVCTGTGSSPTTCMASGYQESETYDAYGRLATRAIVIPNDKTYTYGFAYNATTGRPNVLTYPSTSAGPALTVQYAYAATGVLQSITDTADSPNVTLWTANAQNPASQYTQETLGNDVVLTHAYDPVTGWPTSVTAVPNGGQSLQNNSFLFDAVGNLIQRTDVNRDFTENIYPDADNRIGYTTINGSPDMTMSYNANGSIKSRVFHAISPSTDDYESPNSLVAESSDARAGGTVQWTSYNQPSYIPGPSNTSSTFYYDHNHQRWQQQADYAGATETTTYIGDLLEKVVTGSGTVYRQYVPAGNSTALYLASGSPPSIYYMTSDHLASTSTITDRNGSLVLEESFSPWGARRDPNNWAAYQSTADAAKLTTTTRHGFTGQEHIDNLGLINMNGRIYQGSSFMSPDPRLQDPTDTQNYQRYSYVDNNALTLFDPTGFDEQAPATQDQNCQNSECGVPVGEVTVTCDLTCQLQYALADLSLELQQQFIFSLQQGGQLVGTTSNNVNAQAPSQCAAPPMSSPNGSTAGDIPHFVAVSYIGHDVPESQLNALFSAWRNGSSWAPGGAPNTQDNTPYLLDEVPGDTGYFNWVFVTTNAQNRTFTNWTLPGHVFAGKVVNSIQTYAGFSFMVSEGSGGTQNIALNAALGPVIFKMLQQSVLNNFSPPQVGNQCGRGPKL